MNKKFWFNTETGAGMRIESFISMKKEFEHIETLQEVDYFYYNGVVFHKLHLELALDFFKTLYDPLIDEKQAGYFIPLKIISQKKEYSGTSFSDYKYNIFQGLEDENFYFQDNLNRSDLTDLKNIWKYPIFVQHNSEISDAIFASFKEMFDSKKVVSILGEKHELEYLSAVSVFNKRF